MKLIHGTKETHLRMINDLKKEKNNYFWCNQQRMKPYFLENLKFAESLGILKAEVDINNSDAFNITWYPENQKFGILVGKTYWLQNFNEEGHSDGRCITGRDGDDAWEFETPNDAQSCIDSEIELEGSEILPL
jgi:hypothetical protein